MPLGDHPSYVWWNDGDDPELEAVVYALLEEVTADEGIDFLDHLVTQEVMTYTIKDEILEILAESMCELAADASVTDVLSQVLDMDVQGLARALESPASGQAVGPPGDAGSAPHHSGMVGGLVLPSEQEEGIRPGPVEISGFSDDGGDAAELDGESTAGTVTYFGRDAIQATARRILAGKSDIFATREEDFDLGDSPLGHDLTKADGLSDAEGEYFSDHRVEADIAQRTRDRSYWGAFLAAAGNAWHEPMHRLRTRARQQLRFVHLHQVVAGEDGAGDPIRSARSLGPAALRQHHAWPLSEGQKAEAEAQYASSDALAQQDAIGVDFFVSQSWTEQDEAALALRWEALCAVSDAFQEEHGRPPRFWIESLCVHASNRAENIHDHVTILPVTMAFCKAVLALHTPAYLGCASPRTDGSMWAMADLYISAMLAPEERPNHRVVWFPLFKGSTVPPALQAGANTPAARRGVAAAHRRNVRRFVRRAACDYRLPDDTQAI